MGASSWLLPDVVTALHPIMEEFLFPNASTSALSLFPLPCDNELREEGAE